MPYLRGLDGPNVRFGNEQNIGGMRFPHVELHGNTALAAQEVNEHTCIAALEVHILNPGSLCGADITD